MLSSALATGCAALIYTAVVAPLINAYGRWKTDPQREIVHRRNVFGTFVPDLRRKRIERALWAFAAALFVFGFLCLWTIMNQPLGVASVVVPAQ